MSSLSKTALGRRAEAVVSELLVAQGHRVMFHNLRLGRHEIDLVARSGSVLVAYEVRTRGPGSWVSGYASIDAAKQRRMRAAVTALWRRFRGDRSLERVRLDVAIVTMSDDEVTVEISRCALPSETPRTYR